MRSLLLFLLPIFLAVVVFFAVIFILSMTSVKKGALQVTSLPQSTVYLDGKMIGKTPLCKCDGADMLPVGDYTIKLVPVDNKQPSFEEKISLNPSVLTVVDQTFALEGKSSGSIISLVPSDNMKTAQLNIIAIPYGASVSLDNNQVGVAPLLLQSITDSDHEVTIAKDGYAPKTIRIHGVMGYTLKAIITLATDNLSSSSSSSDSASLSPIVASSSAATKPSIVILQTPTGFLRVRSDPTLSGSEIAQVHPGEVYPLIDDQNNWFEIQLPGGKQGWVSGQYAKKQ